MRIGLNLQGLRPGEIGGLEGYVRALVRHLPALDRQLTLVLFCADYNSEIFEDQAGVEKHRLTAGGFESLSSATLAPMRLDLWFCPLLVLEPTHPGIPAVVNIPDVQHLTHPDFFSQEILAWRRKHYPESVRHADRVLTLSEFSRGEIAQRLGVDPKKVVAIHLGSLPEGRAVSAVQPTQLAAVRAKYRLPDAFLVYPAHGWPHKNHGRLFEALAYVRDRCGDCPDLVLSGGARHPAEWTDSLSRLGIEGRVHILGRLPVEDMRALYTLACALVFPSLFEGFGLPVAEAMRFGCPVLCSNTTSLPEVAGKAACYFDPESVEDVARQIQRVWQDEDLRSELREAGRERARRFTWERTARRTLEVFRELRASRRADAPGVLTPRHPLITVVTPSYQQAPFIERTLRSVLEQDYPRVQYLVVDGGSDDGTLSILERYKKKYPDTFHYISEADSGQADAVNKGLERAEGEIIGWLNSDDTYEPGCFTNVVSAFEQQPVEWMYARANYIDEHDEIISPYPTQSEFDWNTLAHDCYLCQPTVFFKRSLIERGHRLDPNLQMCMDYDFWIRLGREHRPAFVDRYLANSRLHTGAKTVARQADAYSEIFATVKKHYGFVSWGWAMGRAHRWAGGNPLWQEHVSRRALVLTVALVVRHNWSNPRYLNQIGGKVARRVARKLKSVLLARRPTP